MRALVVYESMYGNTRRVAKAVASGVGERLPVRVLSVADVRTADLADCGLLVVGGPTHMHGMSRPGTRRSASEVAAATGSPSMEPHADAGVRDWLEKLMAPASPSKAAAFDTRAKGPSLLTGRASIGISALLRKAGYELVSDPQSFSVSSEPAVGPEELERARLWGAVLAAGAEGADA